VTLAYVGIGSNLEEPRPQVESAFDELRGLPQTRVLKRSSLYRSAPVGYAHQPDFVNAVAELETSLEAPRLLQELQNVELRHGRSRSFANAPRTLDLDLLLYGDGPVDAPGLTVPHPRMHQRAFVLRPLLEIAPGISIPGIGAAQACLRACDPQDVERLA
jgi:2-amino-4-hydroxy-6-hydroxymethyldihydropteridine diphosphokinase